MNRLPIAVVVVPFIAAALACGNSPAAPVAVAAVRAAPGPTGPSPSPPMVVVTGQVTGTVTGQSIGGVSVDLEGLATTTAADGSFRYEFTPGSVVSTPAVTITGSTMLERSLHLSLPGSRQVTFDVIALGGTFDLQYYRRFVRDNFDSPNILRPLRHWNQAPRLYVRTVDEAGNPIEAATLDPVIAAVQDDTAAWTGGRFGLAGLERGTETREGVGGWVTVKWPTDTSGDICGRAQIAVSGGWIELYHLNRDCACNSSRVSAKTAKHELGHAMGFYHSGERDDVMWGTATCDNRGLSPPERFHAAIAYSRPNGNTDPDRDPTSVVLSHEPPIVIVN